MMTGNEAIQLRNTYGISRQEMAKKLGCSSSHIGNLENMNPRKAVPEEYGTILKEVAKKAKEDGREPSSKFLAGIKAAQSRRNNSGKTETRETASTSSASSKTPKTYKKSGRKKKDRTVTTLEENRQQFAQNVIRLGRVEIELSVLHQEEKTLKEEQQALQEEYDSLRQSFLAQQAHARVPSGFEMSQPSAQGFAN